MTSLKISDNESEEKHISENAREIHMYNIGDIFRPRGESFSKESLSSYIYEKMKYYINDWSDPKYKDSLPKPEVVKIAVLNLLDEVDKCIQKISNKLDMIIYFNKSPTFITSLDIKNCSCNHPPKERFCTKDRYYWIECDFCGKKISAESLTKEGIYLCRWRWNDMFNNRML